MSITIESDITVEDDLFVLSDLTTYPATGVHKKIYFGDSNVIKYITLEDTEEYRDDEAKRYTTNIPSYRFVRLESDSAYVIKVISIPRFVSSDEYALARYNDGDCFKYKDKIYRVYTNTVNRTITETTMESYYSDELYSRSLVEIQEEDISGKYITYFSLIDVEGSKSCVCGLVSKNNKAILNGETSIYSSNGSPNEVYWMIISLKLLEVSNYLFEEADEEKYLKIVTRLTMACCKCDC